MEKEALVPVVVRRWQDFRKGDRWLGMTVKNVCVGQHGTAIDFGVEGTYGCEIEAYAVEYLLTKAGNDTAQRPFTRRSSHLPTGCILVLPCGSQLHLTARVDTNSHGWHLRYDSQFSTFLRDEIVDALLGHEGVQVELPGVFFQ